MEEKSWKNKVTKRTGRIAKDRKPIYKSDVLKSFKGLTKEIVDSIPRSASLSEAVDIFLTKYLEKEQEYNDYFTEEIGDFFSNYPREISLFYILMTLRARYNDLFPSPTLCTLLSHTLQRHIAINHYNEIHLKSIELFPALLFHPTLLNRTFFKFENNAMLTSIATFLQPHSDTSEHKWDINKPIRSLRDSSYKMPERTAGRGYYLLHLAQYDPNTATENLFTGIDKFNTHMVFTSWNFLSNEEYLPIRKNLASKQQIQTIVQLPLPSREGNRNYPALLILGQPIKKHINMIDLHSLYNNYQSEIFEDFSKEGITDIQGSNKNKDFFLQEMYANIINEDAFYWATEKVLQTSYKEKYSKIAKTEVLHETILEDPSYRLSPSYYIISQQSKDLHKTTRPLSDYAEVLRYQGERVSIKSEMVSEKNAKEFGKSLFREVSPKDIDNLTGFYLSDDTDFVHIPEKVTILEKYILQENDIVFSFKGSKATIGNVGFINYTINRYSRQLEQMRTRNETLEDKTLYDIPAMPASTFIIIRPRNIDPLYLFNYLQQEDVQQLIQSKASGTSVLSINTKTVKSLPISAPDPLEVEKKHKYYKRILIHLKNIILDKRAIKCVSDSLEPLSYFREVRRIRD